MWGVGQDGTYFNIDEVTELGAPYYRAYVVWNEIEPEFETKGVDFGRLEELIQEYLATKNWDTTDNMVNQLVENGIEPVLVIGVGFDELLPTYQGKIGNPQVLGMPNYITHLYLHTRAVVRRYHDRVHYWQMECHLNEAKMSLIRGERSGFPWTKWDFLYSVLRALRDGVKTEDYTADVTTSLYTDVPDELRQRLGGKTWQEALVDWWEFTDFIGLSSYPNNFKGTPVLGEVVGQRVAEAIFLARGRPVIVMESGYSSGPDSSHTEANQSLFIEEAAESVQNYGGSGFFYSTLYSCDCGNRPTPSENYWGLIGGDEHEKKLAWDTYYNIVNPILASKSPSKSTPNVEQSEISQQIALLPSHTALLANYPNPFNPETWLPYKLAKDADVIINIYDAHGRLIRILPQGKKSQGAYVVKDKAAYWDGKDNFGQLVASGVYFYNLRAGDFSAARKMLIVK